MRIVEHALPNGPPPLAHLTPEFECFQRSRSARSKMSNREFLEVMHEEVGMENCVQPGYGDANHRLWMTLYAIRSRYDEA